MNKTWGGGVDEAEVGDVGGEINQKDGFRDHVRSETINRMTVQVLCSKTTSVRLSL